MAAPNMAAITASLERSLQNCSLNRHRSNSGRGSGGDAVGGRATSLPSSSNRRPRDKDNDNDYEAPENHVDHPNASDTSTTADTTTLELDSHVSLPYHWEQCLDLKTGEIYYINWRNGMKAKEDPRTSTTDYNSGDYYSEDEDEEEEEEENSSYDSEESSSESSRPRGQQKEGQVLVVGGCKSCFMYFMVPKQVQECPKCCGQLLHFDRSENGSL